MKMSQDDIRRKRREYMRAWRERNRAKDKAYQSAYHQRRYADLEFCESKRAAARAWSAANPERKKSTRRAYHERTWEQRYEVMRQWCNENREKLRAYQRAYVADRRARMKGVTIGDVDYSAVIARANGVCEICEKPIRETDKTEFDHIIPISKGGEHSTANLQLTHRRCNRKKNAAIGFSLKEESCV